jgi:hypothetical protein
MDNGRINKMQNKNEQTMLYSLETFINEWAELFGQDQDEHAKRGHNFNVFTLLNRTCNFSIGETGHSKLLSFLLKDYSLHGQKNFFLKLFLEQIGIEQADKGKWEITTEKGRVDIMLKRKNPLSVIIIENKSNEAPDQPNQLYRYWYDQIYRITKETDCSFYEKNTNRFKVIYLAARKEKLPNDDTLSCPEHLISQGLPEKLPVPVHYMTFEKDISQWLDRCVWEMEAVHPDNHPLIEYLRQYKKLCITLKNTNEMSEKLLLKSVELFADKAKWDSFQELKKNEDNIADKWWEKLYNEVYNRELSYKANNPEWEWDVQMWEYPEKSWFLKWFVKGEKEEEREFGSLIIQFYVETLLIDYCGLDGDKVRELITESRFDAIKECFDRIDDQPSFEDTHIGREGGNFKFGDDKDGEFNYFEDREFAWYAGNKTEEFADQLIAKVRKFQTPEITALFKEINAKCKIQEL